MMSLDKYLPTWVKRIGLVSALLLFVGRYRFLGRFQLGAGSNQQGVLLYLLS
jgi:hypothetical protein